jgi:UDP-4-amino-4,6-dideoxy-N-acetyl-beta-L-altrosamine transaminase
MVRIPYGCQWIDDEDIAQVTSALRGELISQGPYVQQFERRLQDSLDVPFVVATSSGTAALHLAAMAAELGNGDTFVTSPLTFSATAMAGILCGASPRFIDIDRDTRNMSLAQLADAIQLGLRPKAILPVHYGGWPVSMPRLYELARSVGACIIEDGAHALGATYLDDTHGVHRVGSCRHSDMTCFSFHPVKHVTTAEGGAVTTRSELLYERLRRLRNHGMERNRSAMQRDDGPWYYEIVEASTNYRLSDVHAALGCSQLRHLESWVQRRREIAERYHRLLGDIQGLILPRDNEYSRSSYHLFPIWIDEQQVGRSRRAVFEALQAREIGVQVHYVPLHLFPFYREQFGTARGQFPEAERFYAGELSLPMFPRLTDAEIERVSRAVRESLTS